MYLSQSIYLKFFQLIPSALKVRVFVLIPLLSLAGVLEVASLAALIPLVGFILEPGSYSEILSWLGIDSLNKENKIFILFSIFFVLIVIKGLFVFFVNRFTFNTALKIKVSFQEQLFKQYINRNYLDFYSTNSANYLRNITTECHQVEGRLIMPGLTLIAELLPMLFIGAFLIYLNPQGVALAAFVLIFSGYAIAKLTSKPLLKYGQNQLASDGMQVKVAKESFSAFREIRLYNKQQKVSRLYSSQVSESASLIGKALALGQIPKLVLEIMGLVVIAIIAFVSFSHGSSATQVFVELTVFIGAIVKLLPSTNRIVMNLQSLTHAKPAVINILNELKDNNKLIKPEKVFVPCGSNSFQSFTFEHVSYKYPSKENFVFDDLNIMFNRGNIYGLIGETGSGKSTMIDLILGMISPSSGAIKVNDLELTKCMAEWRNKVAYIPQDVVLIDDTLKNNILFFADDNENFDLENLNRIIRSLRLDSLITSLPNGLDTYVGEDGSFLSGGQKQRLAIARALIRQPKFLIMDEATSAVDDETERSINDLILSLKGDCTVLIIAHKKSALTICDEIYKVKHGKVARVFDAKV